MPKTETSGITRAYNSFSGVDIKGVFANKVIAELQAISYSVTREKAPIYTMGSPDPRSFSRGKRGIAGTLVFVMFDRHVLLSQLGGYAPAGQGLKFQSDVEDIRPQFIETLNKPTLSASSSLSQVGSLTGNVGPVQTQENELVTLGSDQALALPWYADQIPPFDVTLAAANEYGSLSVMRVFGVELLNEGYGVSIDDIVSEQQHTYVARMVLGWTPVSSENTKLIAEQGGVTQA